MPWPERVCRRTGPDVPRWIAAGFGFRRGFGKDLGDQQALGGHCDRADAPEGQVDCAGKRALGQMGLSRGSLAGRADRSARDQLGLSRRIRLVVASRAHSESIADPNRSGSTRYRGRLACEEYGRFVCFGETSLRWIEAQSGGIAQVPSATGLQRLDRIASELRTA